MSWAYLVGDPVAVGIPLSFQMAAWAWRIKKVYLESVWILTLLTLDNSRAFAGLLALLIGHWYWVEGGLIEEYPILLLLQTLHV
jgi:hypothetical protein